MPAILVTGATGYIGGRLTRRLLQNGNAVRVLVRDRRRAMSREWSERVEIVEGDLTKPDTLGPALEGIERAYFLVHSMYSGADFAEKDRRVAENFVEAASHLRQVIYLGGILPAADENGHTSEHLSSRAEVGQILRAGLPTTEFRAGPIIGSGSASFEMIRYLTERLPAMIAPRWILNDVQTIAVKDILSYLLAALGRDDVEGMFDVGSEPLTFKRLMEVYAEVRGLPRLILPVPVLAPRLAGRWVGLVTPIPNRLALPLVEGVVHPVVGDTSGAEREFPEITPMPYRDSVRRALQRTVSGRVFTRWSGSDPESPGVRLEDREGLIRESRSVLVDAPQADVYRAFASLGGARGWRVWRWTWALRGLIDQLIGGPGLRRGRRDPIELLPGEAVDFWRVEEVKPPSLLRLRAEMKVPGRAWLEFQAIPRGDKTELVQTAHFAPTGFFGWLYWYGIYPLHSVIFSALVRAIGRDAERGLPKDRSGSQTPEEPAPTGVTL